MFSHDRDYREGNRSEYLGQGPITLGANSFEVGCRWIIGSTLRFPCSKWGCWEEMLHALGGSQAVSISLMLPFQ